MIPAMLHTFACRLRLANTQMSLTGKPWQGLLLACILAGCSMMPDPQAAADVHTVTFACADGEAAVVSFSDQYAVLQRQGQAITLTQQPSGSGFIYSNGPHTLRGKGEDLWVETGKRVPIQCTARK